jgi:hypothetical protein
MASWLATSHHKLIFSTDILQFTLLLVLGSHLVLDLSKVDLDVSWFWVRMSSVNTVFLLLLHNNPFKVMMATAC